ncbi:MAG: hypothetical protein QOK31_1375 [Solirubrobacteraceae bacterium]|jgi:hypothetical protein|nr:hypothetical protein [Solirubrobacteraceae bacterium]
MSALTLDPVERSASLFDPVGGGPTLGDTVAGAWEGLAAHAAVDCPVCGERMTPRYGSGASVLGGRCQGCGSALS